MNDELVTAVHEAAHAVAAVVLGHRVKTVAVHTSQTGTTEVVPRWHDRHVYDSAIVSMAGPVAHAKINPTQPRQEWECQCRNDFRNLYTVVRVLSQADDDRGFAKQIHDAAFEGATKLVGAYWSEILAVARGLLAHPEKRLGHPEVVSLMKGLDI